MILSILGSFFQHEILEFHSSVFSPPHRFYHLLAPRFHILYIAKITAFDDCHL